MREVRRDSRTGGRAAVEVELAAAKAELEAAGGRELRLDIAETDAQPEYARKVAGRLLVAHRDGRLDPDGMTELLERLPAVVVVGRLYARDDEGNQTPG